MTSRETVRFWTMWHNADDYPATWAVISCEEDSQRSKLPEWRCFVGWSDPAGPFFDREIV